MVVPAKKVAGSSWRSSRAAPPLVASSSSSRSYSSLVSHLTKYIIRE